MRQSLPPGTGTMGRVARTGRPHAVPDHRRLEHALERVTYLQEIEGTREATFRALGLALEQRGLEPPGHMDRAVSLGRALARAVGLSEEETQALTWGSYLHDVGKIGIADAILLKPGPLTAAEFEHVRHHTLNGIALIGDIPFLPIGTRQVVRSHHERWDGRGYPDTLARTAIPLPARMFSLVDAFDALTNERPYGAPWSVGRALREIEREAGARFDPDLVAPFVRSARAWAER